METRAFTADELLGQCGPYTPHPNIVRWCIKGEGHEGLHRSTQGYVEGGKRAPSLRSQSMRLMRVRRGR
jgi:hypothetical protein